MKRCAIALLLICSLALSGCDMGYDRGFVWEQSHPMPDATDIGNNISVKDYDTLYAALRNAVEEGSKQLTLTVNLYDRDSVEMDLSRAIEYLRSNNPVAAYALQDVAWELGSIGGEQVLVLQMQYLHDQNHIDKMKTVHDMDSAKEAITAALASCDYGIVLRITQYEDTHFIQIVEDYATAFPQIVMETPQVAVSIYPDSGNDRVLELKFSYQTSREILRSMQAQVTTVVDATVNLVSVTMQQRGKYTQMYALLMERFQDYTLDPSITPAYSLLVYGVGDGRACATVYAAMCRQAGMDCRTVVGTRNGELRYWNIVHIDGVYYHVDLLNSKEEGQFREMADEEMVGYVWDYSAYPVCGVTNAD